MDSVKLSCQKAGLGTDTPRLKGGKRNRQHISKSDSLPFLGQERGSLGSFHTVHSQGIKRSNSKGNKKKRKKKKNKEKKRVRSGMGGKKKKSFLNVS